MIGDHHRTLDGELAYLALHDLRRPPASCSPQTRDARKAAMPRRATEGTRGERA
jgi:hypothetical protein